MSDRLRRSDDVGTGGREPLVEMAYDLEVISPSTAVVDAIASAEGVSAVQLATSGRLTLSDHVDPDALDQLFTGSGVEQVTITFLIDEYRIWVREDEITVKHATTHQPRPNNQ